MLIGGRKYEVRKIGLDSKTETDTETARNE